mmetsp:Transcript_119889/g.350471  ORF Transcript_119889/g.350471 Transcript_119889/m.350471 type:complete len:494 (+) Transcript_119889:118-1599(+)
MMTKEAKALFFALQHRKSAKDVQALITADTAKTPDPFYSMKPLFWALSYGASAEVIRLLLEKYPEAANEKHPTEGWTPLHYSEKLDASAVKLLIDKCPGAANEKDAKGSLPLHWAAEHNAKPEVVTLLLQANKDAAFAEDNLGRIPVKLATDAEAAPELLTLLSQANPMGAATLPAPPPLESLPIGIMFPGVGSQKLKMLTSVKDMPAVVDMLKQAKDILGWDVLEVCMNGPETKLQDMAYAQPLLFVAGLAGMEKLRAQNPEAVRRPQAMAGLSLGEYTALCVAGVFTFEEGLKLVKIRGEAMQAAASASKQAMLSVAGLDKPKLAELCVQAAKKQGGGAVCQIANELFPKGFSVAGSEEAILTVKELADKAGALQAKVLKTSGGFHTPLMKPAQDTLSKALDDMLPSMKPPKISVYMNTSAAPVRPGTNPKEIIELMKKQLTSAVLWEPSVRAMIKDGVTDFYEVGPMKQIKAMMKRIDSKVWGSTVNVEV